MIKFSHTIFALPFALIGAMWGFQKAALGWERWDLLLKVVLCMVFARSAAMAFNRYIDRNIDANNIRTQLREIPSGVISPQNALFFIILNCLAFVVTTYFINNLCFILSPVALLVVLGYSLTKRFTALCHLVLGLGLSLAPVGAFFAITGSTVQSFSVIILGIGVLCWTGGFDIIYALQDEEFDRENQLNSIPSKFGKVKALRISEILHIIAAICILTFSYLVGGTPLIFIGAAIFIAMLIYQHILVKPNDLSKVNMAFFTTNGIASVTFAVFVLSDFIFFR
jgi:4-hydroxybenzoate polyprenyltransferase